MKKINIAFWICTVIAAGLMIFSAIPDAMLNPDAIKFMHDQLGFPNYFTRLLGIAKIIGSIAILLPLPARLKEWAYAGLFFDLGGACFSVISAFGFNPQMLGMLIWIAPLVASYILFRKKESAVALKTQFV